MAGKYTLKQRIDYQIKMSKVGATDKDGKKLTDAQRAGHFVKAGQLQNKLRRFASNASFVKDNLK